jgi:hypothetical protein
VVAQFAGEVDRGFAGAAGVRYGIVYEAWAGGRGRGRYVAVDRVLGHKTAWAIEVRPEHSERLISARLKAMRELFVAENERWEWLTEEQRLVVLEGGHW